MNKDYSVKKKYVEQKYQLGVTTYENGVEKTQKKPLCEIPMMIGGQEWTISKLVQVLEEREQAWQVRVKFLEEENAKLNQALEKTIKDLITRGL